MRIADQLPSEPAGAPPGVDLAREPDFRLGELQVRPSRREIVTPGKRALLEPRVMRLLVALVRHRGEVMSRDELIARCWDGRIVGDDAINACVAKLRRTGEATGAYVIETIPRVGYRLMGTAAAGAAAASRADEVLLAVLPFENLSDDPQLSYFSDGVSEEILHTLAQRAGLKVIGRSSSFQFRGADKAIANVTRQLNVTHVLDGAVRRSGQRTRISAQLIDCATQTAVWADRFERDQSDIFALQDLVAAAVAEAMRCALAPAVRSGAVDPIAYDLYLRGNVPPSEMATAYRAQIALLEEAVERAPSFADAWASLGYLRANRAYFLPPAEAAFVRGLARAAALHALDLDPQCALAAAAMARATPASDSVAAHGDWLGRALHWAPDNAIVTHLHSRFLCGVGRGREGLSVIRRAHRLDPLDLHILSVLGRTLCEIGDLDEAAAVLDGARERWDEFQLLLLWRVITLARQGEVEGARKLLAGRNLAPYQRELTVLFDIQLDPTPESGERAIAELRAQQVRGRVTIDALCFAAQRGHLDAAFEVAADVELGPLPEALGMGGTAYNLSLLFTVMMQPIRLDPRFAGLCAKLGLVDYWLATDAWPDCVAETAGRYDFRAECRRAAEAAR